MPHAGSGHCESAGARFLSCGVVVGWMARDDGDGRRDRQALRPWPTSEEEERTVFNSLRSEEERPR